MVELHRVLEHNAICRKPISLDYYTQSDVRSFIFISHLVLQDVLVKDLHDTVCKVDQGRTSFNASLLAVSNDAVEA